jgi:hypothetical protein
LTSSFRFGNRRRRARLGPAGPPHHGWPSLRRASSGATAHNEVSADLRQIRLVSPDTEPISGISTARRIRELVARPANRAHSRTR